MTAQQWTVFGAVQAVAIALMAASNIHTNVLPFIIGYLLLVPGFFISSKIQALGGPVQSVVVAVIINAVFWHFVIKTSRKGRPTK